MKNSSSFFVLIFSLVICFESAWGQSTQTVLLFDHRHISKTEAEKVGNDIIAKYNVTSIIQIGDYSVKLTKNGKFVGGANFGPTPYEKYSEFLDSAFLDGAFGKARKVRIYIIYNPESPIDWNTVPFKTAYPGGPLFYRGAEITFVRVPALELR
jgi:hypothetical protein